MFTRVVDIRTKTGKARELSTTLNEKVLAILRKQPGFVDEIMLVSSTDPDRILALSFWETEENAQHYNREQFPKINEILTPLLQTPPKVETFNVDISTTHKISKEKAA
jgi:quinol monooxygenase YgiN